MFIREKMTNSGFVDYIIDCLSPYGNISARRMFGGYGLYLNQIIFAIIIDLRQVVAWKGCSPL